MIKVGFVVTVMLYELAIETPINLLVKTNQACWKCTVEIQGRTYSVNLICLPLSQLDVILGMD